MTQIDTSEARLEGRQPIGVTQQARTLDEVLNGASAKLARAIESTLDRLRDQNSRPPPIEREDDLS